MCVHVCACVCVHVCVYMCACVCMCVCACVYMCACVEEVNNLINPLCDKTIKLTPFSPNYKSFALIMIHCRVKVQLKLTLCSLSYKEKINFISLNHVSVG